MRYAEQTGGRRRGGRLTSGGAHPTEMYYRLLKKWVGSICLRHKRGKTVFSTFLPFGHSERRTTTGRRTKPLSER
jgi:hypothetical protein